MSAEFEVLRRLAENSGRPSYLIDGAFELLWSNSETPLEQILANIETVPNIRGLTGEAIYPCFDGSAMKVTALRDGGELVLVLFELYSVKVLVDMLQNTSLFPRFIKTSERLYDELTAADIAADTPERSTYGQFRSGSANLLSVLRVLGERQPLSVLDVSTHLNKICGWFTQLSEMSKSFDFSANIASDLFSQPSREALEYAVLNLLMNAVMYSVPPKKKRKSVLLTALRKEQYIVISVEDNGKTPCIDRIKKFRDLAVAPDEADTAGGEGLGLMLTDIVCRKYGGKFDLTLSPNLSGLRAAVTLPYCAPAPNVTFCSSEVKQEQPRFSHSIMLKYFTEDQLGEFFTNA